MTPEQIQLVIDQLFKVGGFLSTEAFRIAIQQVKLVAVTDTIWGILLLVLTAVSAKILKEKYTPGYWEKILRKNDFQSYMVGCAMWAAVILLPITSLCLFTNALMYSINSEWYAVQFLLNMLG